MNKLGKAFVLSLRRRPDRLEHFTRYAPDCFEYIYTNEWPQVHDAREISSGSFASQMEQLGFFDWRIDSDFEWWSRPLKWGEVGCTIGHWKIWERALEMDLQEVYVFEDDARLPPDLDRKIHVIDKEIKSLGLPCDLLYLGRVIEGIDEAHSTNIVKPGYSHCTYAYRLSNAGLKSLLASDLMSNIIPIDEFLPAAYMRHPRDDVAKAFPPVISALAVRPEIVSQRRKSEAGSDTEASEFVS